MINRLVLFTLAWPCEVQSHRGTKGTSVVFTPEVRLVKDVGLPRDWPMPLEIYSDGGIL